MVHCRQRIPPTLLGRGSLAARALFGGTRQGRLGLPMNQRSPVPALDRGLRLLDEPANHPDGLRFTDLTERFGLSKPVLNRLLRVLHMSNRNVPRKEHHHARASSTAV